MQPGMYLVSQPPRHQTGAFGLVSTEHMWVEADMKETELTYVKPGDPVESPSTPIRADLDRHGREHRPAAAREFSVLPAQNACGNWVKVVQRIPVRIAVERKRRRSGTARRHERRCRHRHRPRRTLARPVLSDAVATAIVR